jgi:hypothetical protein
VSEATYISWAIGRLNVPFPAVKKAWSGDRSTVFEIASGDERWFLKIGRRLGPECARLQWADFGVHFLRAYGLQNPTDQDVRRLSTMYTTRGT